MHKTQPCVVLGPQEYMHPINSTQRDSLALLYIYYVGHNAQIQDYVLINFILKPIQIK